MTGLGATLELVLGDMPAAVADPARNDELRALAAILPPLHRAGFECRLGPGADTTVDLQQGLRRDLGGARILRAFLEPHRDDDGPWGHIARLAEAWDTDTLLRESVGALWLELDAAPDLRASLPSVFAVFDRGAGDLAVDAAQAVAGHLLGSSRSPEVDELIARCAGALPPQARVSHLGLMLGRPAQGMRLHVSGLPLRDIAAYLGQVGWSGDVDEVVGHARRLLDVADSVVVCLDAAGGLLPRIGLEAFFTQEHGLDPRWAPLLAMLVDSGLCTAGQADALMAWPGVLTPLGAPSWPDELIALSVGSAPHEADVLERRLSHTKVTLAAGAAPSAKAYFGFGAVFTRLAPEPHTPAPAPATAPAPSLAAARAAALSFLLGRRNQAGWWRDFYDRARPAGISERVTGYASDEWVTAYVGWVLAGVPEVAARDAARDAHEALHGRRSGGGWGYHALLPPDADTTTWVLRLGQRLGAADDERSATARAFVAGLTGADGGVATYRPADAAQLERFLAMPGPYDGWCGVHTCVTAAAAALDLDLPLRAFLEREQRADGSWAGHWWEDDEYATARAVEALRDRGAAVAAAGAWAAAALDAGGDEPSPFAVALALTVLAEAGERSAGERAAARLMATQRADGSWEPSARLRVPPPGAVDPHAEPGHTLVYVDDDAVFTTATVLEALCRWSEAQAR